MILGLSAGFAGLPDITPELVNGCGLALSSSLGWLRWSRARPLNDLAPDARRFIGCDNTLRWIEPDEPDKTLGSQFCKGG